MPGKEQNQVPMDDVPTLTEKSSGLNYLENSMEPRQDSRVEKREPANKNEK